MTTVRGWTPTTLSLFFAIVLGASCGSETQVGRPSRPSVAEPSEGNAGAVPLPTAPRTFGELVVFAHQPGSGDAERDECLFTSNLPARFVGPTAPILRGEITAPEQLGVAAAGRVSLLTRFGVLSPTNAETEADDVGPESRPTGITPDGAELVLALFTPHERVDGGFSLVGIQEDVTEHWCLGDPCNDSGAGAGAASGPAARFVVVTAARAVSLERLSEEIRLLPEDSVVALAVALPPGTRVPESLGPPDLGAVVPDAPNGSSDETFCAGRFEPSGTVGAYEDFSGVVGVLARLRPRWTGCLAYGEGSQLHLQFRLSTTGRVSRACVSGTAPHDRALRSCLLTAVRAEQFPAPTTPGDVDFDIPLSLERTPGPPVRGVCTD